MNKIQLLSPAGTFEALVAAVGNGADAVYLGSKLFNARRLAGNFNQDELKTAVQYAHLHGVKVYLTMNTLVKNQEITPFLNQVGAAAGYGVDALILQDLSFAPLIKKSFPQLEIHASTQAAIMNSLSVKFWQKQVDVFILARELTKQEVREIFDKTQARLEIFVHGHLCISYSGQCLISSLIGKRSGNRGLCASSCRKQYNGDSYLLSARDLCMINNIKDVAESGAEAIKIEGRMKSPEYVATTTRLYRQQLDSYYNQHKAQPFNSGYKKQNSIVAEEDLEDLKLTFNREFTPGYFNNETKIVDPIIPSKRGIYLGSVRNGFLHLNEDVELFNGISCVHKGKKEGDFIKKIIAENGASLTRAHKGLGIKLFVPGFVNGAHVYVLSKHNGRNLLGGKKLIPLSLSISVTKGEKTKIEISLINKSNTVNQRVNEVGVNKVNPGIPEVNQKFACELKSTAVKALRHPLTAEEIKRQLEKFQSHIFTLEKIDVKTDNSFIPKSDLTAFRNELDNLMLDQLVPVISEQKMFEQNISKEKKIEPLQNSLQFTKTVGVERKLHVRVYSKDDALQAVNAGADVIYYDAFAADVQDAAESVRDFAKNVAESVKGFARNAADSDSDSAKGGAKFYLYTPMVLADADFNRLREVIAEIKPDGLLVNNVGVLSLPFSGEIILGHQMNIFNDQQLAFYGYRAIASLEINLAELSQFADKEKLLYYAHGCPVVMTFKEEFDASQLTDKKGYTFKLRKTQHGATEMLYSKTIALLQHTPKVLAAGITQLFLDVEKDVFKTVDFYKKALQGKQASSIALKRNVTVGNLVKGVM